MKGSAAPYAAVAGLSGRLSRHDSGLVGGGFELVLAEFRVAADEFDQLVELELRRRRTEHERARDAGASPPRRPATAAVPPWLADSDRQWCSFCDQVLKDLAAAGPALRDTAASYQQTDSRLAARLDALAAEGAAGGLVARPLPFAGSTEVVPTRAARGDPPAHRVADRPGVPGLPAAPTPLASPATLAEALALWRARSGDSAQLTDALTADVLAVPSWRGTAAQDYEQWLTRLADACHRLCDHAERVHRDLARPDPTGAISGVGIGIGAAPPPPADGDAPITLAHTVPAEQAAHIPASSHCHASAPSPPSTLFLPDHVWQHHAALTAAARDPQPECPPTTAPQPPDTRPDTKPDNGKPCEETPRGDRRDERTDPGTDPGTDHEHDRNCDCDCSCDKCGDANDINPDDDPPEGQAEDNNAHGGEGNDSDSGNNRDNSNARCDDSPTDTDPPPEAPDRDPGTAPRRPDDKRGSPAEPDRAPEQDRAPEPSPAPTPAPVPSPPPTPTPMPTPTPSAPPTSVPGEPQPTAPGGPPPPDREGPVDPTSSRSDNTALLAAAGATAIAAGAAAVFLARRDRARTPRSPDIADTAPIPPLAPEPHGEPHPTDPQLTADSAAAAPSDGPTEGSPADGPDGEGSDQPPAPATPQPRQARPWLHIGTLHEQPVLIDPVATHGLGLTGPGAAAVARSLASGLLDMDDGDILVAATDTINALLEQPADYPVTPTDPSDDVPPGPDGDERGHDQLRVMPDPFTALEALEAELTHRRATPAPPAGWPLCVLLAPAPTTTPTQHRLAAALTAGQSFKIAAILIGWWPTGWNCHVDDNHRVTQHTQLVDDARRRSPQRDSANDGAPTTPAQIVGAQLSTSTPAELRQALSRTAPQPTDDGPDSRPQPQDPTPALDQSDPIGAASSEIREALDPGNRAEHASGDNARRRDDPSTDPSPEPDQPDPAPEQLAERQPRDSTHPTSQHTGPPGAPAPSGPGTVTRPPLWLSIFGPTVLRYTPHLDPAAPSPGQVGEPGGTGVVIDRLGPRATELLVYLAVHPHGVGRDRLVAALWPDADRSRPTNALNAVLARLRKTLRTTGDPDLAQVVIHVGGRYLLNSNLIGVDYWDFLIAAADITHPDPDHRAQACDTAIRTYQGHLAADLTSEWLITVREATRRRYFDTLTTLARLTIHHDPERTLGLLETARNLEPLKEGIYRDIMRIQAQLNRPDAAENTLALLRAQLADIDAEPEPETLQLAATIRHQASRHQASRHEASHHNGPDTATPTA